jgi:hypothetical protein
MISLALLGEIAKTRQSAKVLREGFAAIGPPQCSGLESDKKKQQVASRS